jgi:hypothetical protein
MEEEESGPSMNDLTKSQWIIEREQIHEQLDTRVTEAEPDADNF